MPASSGQWRPDMPGSQWPGGAAMKSCDIGASQQGQEPWNTEVEESTVLWDPLPRQCIMKKRQTQKTSACELVMAIQLIAVQ